MGNISSIAQATTAATALSNLILVTPQQTVGYQPQNKNGSTQQVDPPILFHYEGENTVSLVSDITDHFVEDNTALQDQIALRPEIITTHGFIGELNDVAPKALIPIKAIADKLTTVGAYLPSLTLTAQIAYNEAFFAYQIAQNTAHSAVSAWSTINGGSSGESVIDGNADNSGFVSVAQNQNKQQKIFQVFYGYWRTRRLFTIQTPWAIFQNCAIMSLRAIQDAETRMITDFEVTFKLLRFSSSFALDPVLPSDFQGRASLEASPLIDLGTQNPQQPESFVDSLNNNFPGSFSTGIA